MSTHLTDCLYRVPFRRYRPLKLPLSCEVVQKRWFLSPRFVGGGVSQISDLRFQITLTSDHVTDFRSVPFSDLGDQAAKKRRKNEEERRKKHG